MTNIQRSVRAKKISFGLTKNKFALPNTPRLLRISKRLLRHPTQNIFNSNWIGEIGFSSCVKIEFIRTVKEVCSPTNRFSRGYCAIKRGIAPLTAKAQTSPNFQHPILQLVVIPEPALSLNDNLLLSSINKNYTSDYYILLKMLPLFALCELKGVKAISLAPCASRAGDRTPTKSCKTSYY